MDELNFNNSSSITINESNIGGPPVGHIPFITINNNLTSQQKHAVFQSYLENQGYNLFDFTKITDTSANNEKTIVNNTSFYVFFSIFLILLILLIALVVNGYMNTLVGLYLLLILSIIIYVASVLYRQHTLTSITSSTQVVNEDIKQNKILFDHSVLQLPNNIVQLSQNLLSSDTISSASTSASIMSLPPSFTECVSNTVTNTTSDISDTSDTLDTTDIKYNSWHSCST
ncbi:MAG TPA: hypothetical protein VLG50_05140 [Candidatus Saccharimonadales bacterium]|nr:hypothetical protein [Candidatus Saccharimonadales bacterium]